MYRFFLFCFVTNENVAGIKRREKSMSQGIKEVSEGEREI